LKIILNGVADILSSVPPLKLSTSPDPMSGLFTFQPEWTHGLYFKHHCKKRPCKESLQKYGRSTL